jgi:Sec-independent protein translocase protein TatA
MGGFSIWHWIILLAVILIPVAIIAIVLALSRRKK